MAQILKFPVQAAKLGYKRVKKRARAYEDPDQLDFFSRPTAQILILAPELSRFEQALILDERGDLKASELYAQAIEQNECVADAYCNLGIIESQKGNTTRAFDCFTTSLKHDPRHSESHYNLGNLYFDVNDLRLALIHYQIAAEVEPTFANVYFNLGLVQAMNNDLGGAASALARYQELVSYEEGRIAEELLHNLRKSLAAKNSAKSTNAELPHPRLQPR
jgi:tetratricopeptide (TPR) repeat protein